MSYDILLASDAISVTPDDATDLTTVAEGLYVGGAGNINLDTADGTTVVFSGLAAGAILPIKVARVRSTSTTATNILALYFNRDTNQHTKS